MISLFLPSGHTSTTNHTRTPNTHTHTHARTLSHPLLPLYSRRDECHPEKHARTHTHTHGRMHTHSLSHTHTHTHTHLVSPSPARIFQARTRRTWTSLASRSVCSSVLARELSSTADSNEPNSLSGTRGPGGCRTNPTGESDTQRLRGPWIRGSFKSCIQSCDQEGRHCHAGLTVDVEGALDQASPTLGLGPGPTVESYVCVAFRFCLDCGTW